MEKSQCREQKPAKDVDSSLNEEVLYAVAEVDDTDPVELPPLFNVVDPDCLNNLFQEQSNGSVAFEYNNYMVNVRADGEVTVR